MDTDSIIDKSNDFASKMAGEYISSIGKVDLSTFTKDEWNTLIDVITKNYEITKITLTGYND